MKTKTIFLIVLVVFAACKPHNKLNTDEQKLANEIKTEEQQKKETEETARQNAIAIPDSIPQGFRFLEDRSIDANYPPKVIDIANLFYSAKDYKLSELINDIEYILLEEIPESANYKTNGYRATLADNHILIKSMMSLHLFHRDGTFKDVICEGEDENAKTQQTRKGMTITTMSTSAYRKGVWGDVWTIDNKLFYRYADNKDKQFILMSYDMDAQQNSIPLPSETEGIQITGKGEMHASLGITREKRFTEYVPLSKDSYAGINRKTKSSRNGLLMTSFRLNGDTLSSFPDFETISNYSHSVMRGNFPQFTYHYGNVLTFRNAFNDTVYRVIPPNRLIPAYILNMGEFKIESQEGLTPGQDISSKLYIKEFFETQKYIYLKLSRGYGSPNNREKKSVKIFYAIYEKETEQLNILPFDPTGYYGVTEGQQTIFKPQGITNDFDGGFPYWPQKVSPKGEAYEVVKGEKLKKHVSSDRFIHSTAPQNQKDELKKLAEDVGDDQLILIVYKEK